MTEMQLSELAQVVNGVLVGNDMSFQHITTDSRSVVSGDLFVAIHGDRFDGHHYVEAVSKMGATAALISQDMVVSMPVIKVKDTRIALGQMAGAWRLKHPIPVIAVTGSNGKTTVKEMIARILSNVGLTMATQGNFNNEIGLPITLMRLNEEIAYAVIEMGANHMGEIGYLTQLTKPSIRVITNAGTAHLEGFGSIEGVAKTKGEILSQLQQQDMAILNQDDPFFDFWSADIKQDHICSFGLHENADVYAQLKGSRIENGHFVNRFVLNYQAESIEINLALAGHHNVVNACAAAAAAIAAGLNMAQIKSGLEQMEPVKGRLQPTIGPDGCCFINDTYNANPASCEAALKVLSECPGKRFFILGDMAELGENQSALHHEMGEKAKQYQIDELMTFGDLSVNSTAAFGRHATHFDDMNALIDSLNEKLSADAFVLVKGSRKQKMERVIAAFSKQEIQD